MATGGMTRVLQNEKIIAEVERRRPLWDIRSPTYKNIKLKAQLWQQVAEDVDWNVDELQARWKNLRDSFGKRYKALEKARRSGAGGEEVEVVSDAAVDWPYFKQLFFLKDVYHTRRTTGNLSQDVHTGSTTDPQETAVTILESVYAPSMDLHASVVDPIIREATVVDSPPSQPASPASLFSLRNPSSSSSSSENAPASPHQTIPHHSVSPLQKKKKSTRKSSEMDKLEAEVRLLDDHLYRNKPDAHDNFAKVLADMMRKCKPRLVTQMRVELLQVLAKYEGQDKPPM